MDEKIIQPDGSLHTLGDPFYVNWKLNDAHIVLDGEFTVEDLLWFISYMQKAKAED